MAQKTNLLNIKLKKRFNWKLVTGLQNYKNFSKLSINSYYIARFFKVTLSNLNFFCNNLSLTKNSKNYRLFANITDDTQTLKDLIIAYGSKNFNLMSEKKTRLGSIDTKKKKQSKLNFKLNGFLFELSNVAKIKQNNLVKHNVNHSFFILPSLLLEFTKYQLDPANIRKNKFYNSSLQLGLTTFLTVAVTSYFLTLSTSDNTRKLPIPLKNIIGLRIECKGRWKKTKSGRKQKLSLSIGKTNRIGMKNLLFFSSDFQKTKFATCGFKVWIAYKNTQKTFLA